MILDRLEKDGYIRITNDNGDRERRDNQCHNTMDKIDSQPKGLEKPSYSNKIKGEEESSKVAPIKWW
eukprot:c36549_g1_i1 orf=59-259(+)